MYSCIFIFIYLPAITCSHSKFRPSPTDWRTVCLPVYLYVCTYVCMYIYIYIYLESPAVILSSDPPQPIDLLSVCLPIYLYTINVYIYIYIIQVRNHILSARSMLVVGYCLVSYIWTRRLVRLIVSDVVYIGFEIMKGALYFIYSKAYHVGWNLENFWRRWLTIITGVYGAQRGA